MPLKVLLKGCGLILRSGAAGAAAGGAGDQLGHLARGFGRLVGGWWLAVGGFVADVAPSQPAAYIALNRAAALAVTV